VLFAEEGSAVVALTVAVSVSVVVPGAFTFTVNVIGPQLFPKRSDPTRAQVNVPPAPTGGVVQFPFVLVKLTNVVPLGKFVVKVSPSEASGPPLCTENVYVKFEPSATGFGLAVALRVRSADTQNAGNDNTDKIPTPTRHDRYLNHESWRA